MGIASAHEPPEASIEAAGIPTNDVGILFCKDGITRARHIVQSHLGDELRAKNLQSDWLIPLSLFSPFNWF